jgi:sialic acid synthase SpsE
LSLDTYDFLQLKKELREAQISKGNRIRKQFNSEIEAVKFARRSIVSTMKIKKGEKITKSMLDVKRPGTGIPPKFFDKIIGHVVIHDIKEDMPLEWKNIRKK